jgi:hypothetical protein
MTRRCLSKPNSSTRLTLRSPHEHQPEVAEKPGVILLLALASWFSYSSYKGEETR